MIKKVKVVNGNGWSIPPLPNSGRTPFYVEGQIMDAWFLDSDQAILLHKDGVLWLPKGALLIVDSDTQSEEKKGALNSLRQLIGQEMKNVSFEFK